MADNQDELISHFVEITGASPAEAQEYLAANQWDLSGASTEYFTALEEGDVDDEVTTAQQPGSSAPPEPYTGPRTLDGRPAPDSARPTASGSTSAPPKRGGVATLGSLGSSSQGGHGHAHDDDDDSDDDDEANQPRDLFAGGEKSGLAVQDPSKRDPRKVVNDILKRARENAKRPEGEDSEAAPSRFRGTGQTLGDESTPSQPVPDSNTRAPSSPPVTRILHIWEEGFSIEDGELRRFDDPRHARDLQMIQNGRAPLHLMGVRADQAVDVQLIKHNEKYKAPPKVYKPFSGGGNRLGSPTPGGSSTAEVAAPAAPAASAASAISEPTIDASQPTLTLRVQLANGTRLPARFNTTSTVGDVYDFITRATPSAAGRPWVLATTFPNKDHTDKSLQLGDVAEFKRGGTAVQKWS